MKRKLYAGDEVVLICDRGTLLLRIKEIEYDTEDSKRTIVYIVLEERPTKVGKKP